MIIIVSKKGRVVSLIKKGLVANKIPDANSNFVSPPPHCLVKYINKPRIEVIRKPRSEYRK